MNNQGKTQQAHPNVHFNASLKRENPQNSNHKKKLPFIILVIIAIIVAITVLVVLVVLHNNQTNNTEQTTINTDILNDPNSVEAKTAKEQQEITENTLKQYAEVEVEGYQQTENESGSFNAVVTKVKNISDKRVSIAVDIVAKDQAGNILDTGSLYAEGIEPEQTQIFRLFTLSSLSPEELQTAKYEVSRAYIYNPDGQTEQQAEEGVKE